ncbi:MAG: hypothetical protein HEQ13_02790 [Dolichospermum sp. DEX189]|nr:hypothetical protein [Dolichospermum sp. DEX189]
MIAKRDLVIAFFEMWGRSGQHKLLRAIVPGMGGIIGGCDRCVMVYVYE